MAPRQQQQQDDGGGQRPSGLVFEQFAGMNTAVVRAGVPDEQAYWLDGFMPVATRQLRILYGQGSPYYVDAFGRTVVCFYFYNIKSTAYGIAFLSDGGAIQFDTTTAAATQILPTATLNDPKITDVGISQYGQQYLLIVANQSNGYWIWDGSLLYTSGTLGPEVTITDVGSGYTETPVVGATGGSGSGASFVASMTDGTVTDVTVTNPGSGYKVGDVVTLTFSGNQAAGINGALTAVLSHQAGGSAATITLNWVFISHNAGGFDIYTLNSVTITNGGSGYQDKTTTTNFTNGTGHWYQNSAPTLKLTISGGVITNVTVAGTSANPLSYYLIGGGQVLPTGATVTDPGYYYVSSVTINNAGTGYGPNTSISVTSGGNPITQAVLTPVLTTGSITSVTINDRGAYGSNTPPTLTVNDSSSPATATVEIMPFGIQGTAVQTYQGSVWVFNGPNYNFSAPGSVVDFSTANGGGSGKSSDNFLRVGYTAAIQTNGFLFIIGDSSMNYISGVQTSGNPPTTTFTNQNSDPEVGTPYPASAVTLGQEIFIANDVGVFVSSGGAFVKRSNELDGVYGSVPRFGGLQLSAAKATIFGKRVWMVLVPVIDPINGVPTAQETSGFSAAGSAVLHFASVPDNLVAGMLVYCLSNSDAFPIGVRVLSKTATTVTLSANATVSIPAGFFFVFFRQKLFMFNGKQWWASQQESQLTFISGQEINSVYKAWGTDGTSIFPLFQTPSAGFTKIAQTKLWDDPGYEINKTVNRFWSLWHCYSVTMNFTLTVDSIGLDPSGNQFANSASYALTAAGEINTTTPTIAQAVGQQGILVGMTFTTTATDMALVSAKLLPDTYQYRG